MNKPDKKTKVLCWSLIGFLGLTGLSLYSYIQFQKGQLTKLTAEVQHTPLPVAAKPVSVSEVYHSIEANAKDCQMMIFHFSVSQSKADVKAVMVDLVLEGDYRDFTRFLINIQRETSHFDLLSCRMAPSKAKNSAVDITLKLRFKTDGRIQ